jgi:Do/DeqQ family serine protease
MVGQFPGVNIMVLVPVVPTAANPRPAAAQTAAKRKEPSMPEKPNRINKNRCAFLKKICLAALLLFSPAGLCPGAPNPRNTPVVRAVKTVSPAVVNISSRQEARRRPSPFSNHGINPFFEHFFRDFFEPGAPRRYSRSSLGSGVIIDGSRGFILTNAHVIENAGAITVSLMDEREFDATVVGTDPDSDLAVLKIQSPQPLPSVSMGRSDDLMIGETVIAIGNPFGFSHTVTTGVISAVGRSIRSEERVFRDFIQIDASINPGNSGGPLLNIKGELIGVNTAIYAKAQGIGFAIPIQKAGRIVSDLIAHGEVIPAWFGLTVQALDPNLARYRKVPPGSGVVIRSVADSGPAAAAGVRDGDILLSLGGKKVENPDHYSLLVRDFAEGDPAPMVLWREKSRIRVVVTASVFPLSEARSLGAGLLGVRVDDISPALRRHFRIYPQTGVVITDVDPTAYLGRIGAAPGDVILRIDDTPIENTAAFDKAVIKSRLKPSVVILLQRQDQGYYITVKLYGK